jgi:hypothetical protein
MRGTLKDRRPSAGLVVGVVALIAALAGTAIATSGRSQETRLIKAFIPRVTGSDTASKVLSGPSTGQEVARTAKISAPRDGYLYMTASSQVGGSASDILLCDLKVDGSLASPTIRNIELPTGGGIVSCATNGVVRVPKGDHVVKFVYSGRDDTTTVQYMTLDVLFASRAK